MQYFGVPFISFGDDSLQYLAGLKGRRALIITDATIVRLGLAKLVEGELKKAGMECKVFDGVEPDPSIETVIKAKGIALDYKPDWLVGLGGGSSMDTAKSTYLCYVSGRDPNDISVSDYYNTRETARLVCIPTTSGTGAEVTWQSVLTDVKEQRKLICGTSESLADIAILDPVMVVGMPPQITGDTGMDALCHAIEAYTTMWRNPFTDGAALAAVDLIMKNLKRAYDDGKDEEARKNMMYGACQAGISMGNSNLGLGHSTGHALGGIFHTPHGRAVGLFLPFTMEYAARGSEEALHYYAEIARFCSISRDADDSKCFKALTAAVRSLARSIGQPATVKDLGINRDEYFKNMEGMVDRAINDAVTMGAARVPETDDLEKIFTVAYDGKPVDF